MNKVSQLVIFVLLISSFFSAHAQTFVSDDIEVSTTWTKEYSPYIVNSRIVIYPAATLTINPGVVVKFDSSLDPYSVNDINSFAGEIIAIGSESEPIIFTSIYDDTTGDDTDSYEECYEPTDEEGNVIGEEVCELYDMGDPFAGDWGGIHFYDSVRDSVFKHVQIRYAERPLEFYNASAILEHLEIRESMDVLTIYEGSHVKFDELSISGVYRNGVSIFNGSSFVGENLQMNSVLGSIRDMIEVFNSSVLDIKHSTFSGCPNDSCITIFDGTEYVEIPSWVNLENILFDGGSGSGILTFTTNSIPIVIRDSLFRNFDLFAIENYSSATTVGAKENDWGSVSGPYHPTANPAGQGEELYGLVDFDPWIGKAEDISPTQYYARITNIPTGVAYLYDAPTITSMLVKTLPNDWVVRVVSKVNESGSAMFSNGYRWYKVEDPTDKTLHYMIAGTGNAPNYLPYEFEKQTEYEVISIDNLSGNTNAQRNKRRQVVLDAVDHYYNNTSTQQSLYSSDDHINNISLLKIKGFSKDLIRAFIAVEIGGANFDNERVSGDYGHGIMQVTFKSYNDQRKNYDNRGIFSDVKNILCTNYTLKNGIKTASNDYKKCYSPVYNSKNVIYKQIYSNYNNIPTNPIYKNYINSTQSIYGNIKDGLGLLSSKFGTVFPNKCTKDWVTQTGLVITCEEISVIKTLWGYNGASVSSPDYLGKVSDYLKNLSTYFPGYTYNNSDKMIEKLAYAGRNRVEIKKRSPITINVTDSNNNSTGEIGDTFYQDIPYSAYSPEAESIVIFFPDDNYTYKVVGDSTGGTYGLDIDTYNGSTKPISFNASDIPIIPGEIHTYTIDQKKLATNKPDAVTLQIDRNGDGIPEKTIITGDTLTSVAPYDFYFKKPKDGEQYKINKELPIKIKVLKEEKKKIKIPHPEFTITRLSDGYVLPLANKKLTQDDEEDSEDKKYYKKFQKKHNKNYVLRLPKNTLTEGLWEIKVSLGDLVTHSIIITMIK